MIKPSLIILIVIAIMFAEQVSAQSNDPVLIAEEYLNQGEVDKAKTEFEKLARNKQYIPRIHDAYLNLLLAEQDFNDAEKYLKSVIRQMDGNYIYEIDMA
ncbi:MAG TPA: hypothetical protein VIN11_05060, partial [Roseivirga sp.]